MNDNDRWSFLRTWTAGQSWAAYTNLAFNSFTKGTMLCSKWALEYAKYNKYTYKEYTQSGLRKTETFFVRVAPCNGSNLQRERYAYPIIQIR